MNTIQAIHQYLTEQGLGTTINKANPVIWVPTIIIVKPNEPNYIIRLKLDEKDTSKLLIFIPTQSVITIDLHNPKSLPTLYTLINTTLHMKTHTLPDHTTINTILSDTHAGPNGLPGCQRTAHNAPWYRINNGPWTPSNQRHYHTLNQTAHNATNIKEFLDKENQ